MVSASPIRQSGWRPLQSDTPAPHSCLGAHPSVEPSLHPFPHAYLGCPWPAPPPLQIDVVGVDGELKDVALRALNARPNFAYSLKEVGRRRQGCRLGNTALPLQATRGPSPNQAVPRAGHVGRVRRVCGWCWTCRPGPSPAGPGHWQASTALAGPCLAASACLHAPSPQIMDDMHRVFGTGYFSMCKPAAEETRDGIKLTLEVGARPRASVPPPRLGVCLCVGGGGLGGGRLVCVSSSAAVRPRPRLRCCKRMPSPRPPAPPPRKLTCTDAQTHTKVTHTHAHTHTTPQPRHPGQLAPR